MRRTVVQANRTTRGGWNTALRPRDGCITSVLAEMRDEVGASNSAREAHHAHESACRSTAPAGTAGVAGLPEHQLPVHGRRGADKGSGFPARSSISGSMSDDGRPKSVRDVTRWPQPAHADRVEQAPITRSANAPIPNRASRLRRADLIVTKLTCAKRCHLQRAMTDELRESAV
jgi:hypothetical protein